MTLRVLDSMDLDTELKSSNLDLERVEINLTILGKKMNNFRVQIKEEEKKTLKGMHAFWIKLR